MRAKYVRMKYPPAPQDVAERWNAHYLRDKPADFGPPDKHAIYDRLVSAGPQITREQAAAIIGNQSWTHLSCDGCADYVNKLVEIGEYDAKGYCWRCIREAFELLMCDA